MKKVLLIGPEVTDFLNPLANKFKELGYTVDLLENRKILRNDISITKSYSTVLNYQQIIEKKITVVYIIKYLFKKEFIENFFKEIFINCIEEKCRIIKSFKNCLTRQHLKERFAPILNNYDIINFHSLSPATLSFVNFINPNKKIILSFWGSDLYQISGAKNYNVQLGAMRRADIITVQSYEMELMVLAKFGSEIKNKIVRALFGIKDEIFDRIDDFRKIRPDLNFLNKHNLPENKIKITIGYCGNPICNHLLILEEMERIEHITKANIHLLVPMTYGNFSKEYMDEVKLKLDQTKISYTLFDKFLPFDEVLKLRLHSDIMIMMNKSDALSQSVSEFLYANNLLISATWLPYSPFRLEKIFFYETDFTKLCETVSYAVGNFSKIKINLIDNPDKVKKLTAFSQIWQQWVHMFDSL